MLRAKRTTKIDLKKEIEKKWLSSRKMYFYSSELEKRLRSLAVEYTHTELGQALTKLVREKKLDIYFWGVEVCFIPSKINRNR